MHNILLSAMFMIWLAGYICIDLKMMRPYTTDTLISQAGSSWSLVGITWLASHGFAFQTKGSRVFDYNLLRSSNKVSTLTSKQIFATPCTHAIIMWRINRTRIQWYISNDYPAFGPNGRNNCSLSHGKGMARMNSMLFCIRGRGRQSQSKIRSSRA